MAADLRRSVSDLDRWCPWWALFYRPYGPAKAPQNGFRGCCSRRAAGLRRGSERRQTSPTSRPGPAGSIWPPCSIATPTGSSVGRWTRTSAARCSSTP